MNLFLSRKEHLFVTDSTSIIRRLCNYYLACLANDDAGGVSIPLKGKDQSQYAELEHLSLDSAQLPGWNEKLSEFVSGRRTREPGMLRLGYPVLLTRGGAGEDGRRAMPIFLIDVAADNQGIEPDWRTCSLNLEAVRVLEGNGVAFAQHSVMELEEGLGLDVNGEPKPFAQVVERLKMLRPEWPWAGSEPEDKPLEPLYAVKGGLIYERGMLLKVSRPYTQGLEIELQKLAQIPEHALYGTALGALLFGEQAIKPRVPDNTPLLEVLPMNPEQRIAVRMALNEPLSVITGPPGTGKSQVVANLLINSTWRKRPVLFTSKNNKAVDVVEGRVNKLGNKPIMVRLGSKEHRGKLAEQLEFLVSGTVSAEDLDDLKREQANYDKLVEDLARLDEEERAALEVYEQAKRLLDEMQELGKKPDLRQRNRMLEVDFVKSEQLLYKTRDKYLEALAENHSRWAQLVWPLLSKRKARQFMETFVAFKDALGVLAASTAPAPATPEEKPQEWKDYIIAQADALSYGERVLAYAEHLKSMRQVSFEELSAKRNRLQDRLVQTSMALWQRWVSAQPALLSADQRLMLSRYHTVLKSVIEAGGTDSLPDEVRREYERITLEAPDVVSCFAVTALSARNRVPFTPGYFDLVVFDESSQCDLASALPILFRAKRAVIIGDPKQLQHIATLRRDKDASFMVDQKLETSYLDWQYSTQSLFSVVASRVADKQKVSLRDHHRSHPHVIGYSNEAFYDRSLRIVTKLPVLKRFTSEGPAVRWLDVKSRAVRGRTGSWHNPDEAAIVVEEIRRIVKAGYPGSIGVVTPFSHQADQIRYALERDSALWQKLRLDHDFQSTTAHGFQGDERDLMIFSVVAAPGLHESGLRFLEDDCNVFNVAITRARAELVVVGDATWCTDAPISHLRDFARFALALTREQDREWAPGVQVGNAAGAPSDEEIRMAEALESLGHKVLVRAQVEQYRVDLVVVNGVHKLAIDIVDRSAPGDWGAEALEREQLKRQRLLKLGWSVMRFWPIQVRDDFNWCISQVQAWAKHAAQ